MRESRTYGLGGGRAMKCTSLPLLRRRDTEPLTVVWILLTASAAFAAEPMAPSDIQATFFNGEPFTASTPGGAKFRMTFMSDGKMTVSPSQIRPEEQWHVET